jgi:hypothetical protein
MIRRIEIENIKGIGSGQYRKQFDLDIVPNKPSLLVAPNGFGKSSIAVAFKSMNRDRIKLSRENCHKEDETKNPLLKLRFKQPDNIEIEIYADNNSNTISNHFDFFVINSPLKAKGVGQSFGGRTNVSAYINVEPIVLIDSIPEKINLGYSFSNSKTTFGNGRIALLNLNNLLDKHLFICELNCDENFTMLDRTNNQRVRNRILAFKGRLNQNPNTLSRQRIIEWIREYEMDFLKETQYLNTLSKIIQKYDFPFPNDKVIDSFIYAISLIELYHTNRQNFKNYCKRKDYELMKTAYIELFRDLNSSWTSFRPKESQNSLIMDFPKPHLISNGQRDVLSFMANLEKARYKLRKHNCILVIDEMFDYLDDANLVAVQYYTTQLIEEFKKQNRKLYPLILTHLDPYYFKGYVFGRKHKLKTYYLLKSEASVNQHLIKILKERNIQTSIVKADIEKYLLHYHTARINRREDFRDLNLKETWGESDNFDNYITEEVTKYISDEEEFDPFAVCCGVRKRIEKTVYDKIDNPENMLVFLEEKSCGTNDKLEYAESIGIPVNESYYFLGIIYNEALHWKDDRDNNSNISPAMGKLKNMTIRKLIKSVFEE